MTIKVDRVVLHQRGIFWYYKLREVKPYYNEFTKSMNVYVDCWYLGIQLGGKLWGSEYHEYDGMRAEAFNILGLRFIKGTDYVWEDLGNV